MRKLRIDPGPGRESVCDYPRPPRLEHVPERLRAVLAGVIIADTVAGRRVLETSHPPSYYFPPHDVLPGSLVPVAEQSWCEWKGRASYFDVVTAGRRAQRAAWCYHDPTPPFASIQGHFAFNAASLDSCWVGEEQALPQDGGFYGGWITARIVGPFKGGPGTMGW